jgi:hypothetical protein
VYKLLYKRVVVVILVSVFCASCFDRKSIPADSDLFKPSKRLAELKNKKLEEISGLAASVLNPGLLWVHNDSGNPAVVYLVDENLNIRLSCRLKGVKNRDWEDIAVGPGPDKSKRYVYVADIGDNDARHEMKYIYRFEEPQAGAKSGEITISEFDTIAFKLSGDKKDTEAIMVHPETQNIYVVSKREKPVHVYELQYPFGNQVLMADDITAIPLTQIVAADISTDGEEILMKDYDNVYYWNTKGRPVGEVLKEKPLILHYTEEPQGEAIAFKTDGSGFYTLSESLKGERTFLFYYERNSR